MKRKTHFRGCDGGLTAVGDLPDEPRRAAAKKDTKRWCGGHAGREHRKVWVRDKGYGAHWKSEPDDKALWSLECSVCGKRFDWCGLWFSSKHPCKCGRHAVGRVVSEPQAS